MVTAHRRMYLENRRGVSAPIVRNSLLHCAAPNHSEKMCTELALEVVTDGGCSYHHGRPHHTDDWLSTGTTRLSEHVTPN